MKYTGTGLLTPRIASNKDVLTISGSTILSGSLTVTDTIYATSSYSLTASYALAGGSAGTIDTSSFVSTSSFNSFTSSYVLDSGSLNSRITNLTSNTSSYLLIASTSSMLSPYVLSTSTGSFVTISQTSSFALSANTASYATTGSNTFNGTQNITGSIVVSSSNVTVGQFVGSQNGYIEFSVRNTNSGISASGDIAVYANTGTPSNNYVDIGINNSGLTSSYFYGGTNLGGALDSYIYNVGGNLRIGNATSVSPSQSLFIFSNPTGTPDITITGSKVGIQTTSPTVTLDVNGIIKASSYQGDGSSLTGIISNTNRGQIIAIAQANYTI